MFHSIDAKLKKELISGCKAFKKFIHLLIFFKITKLKYFLFYKIKLFDNTIIN